MDHHRHGKGSSFDMAGRALLGLIGLALMGPAQAVDGVVEINQAKAQAGGVTSGDFGGFPVTLSERGSYRLTGDLNVPAGAEAITVDSDDITLDLNGFHVIGGGGALADGIGLSGRKNIEIRNGTIRGFSRSGIFSNINTQFVRVIGVRAIGNTGSGIELQGNGHLVDGCTAFGNGGAGIRANDGSLVINSVARGNTGLGLVLSASTGYRSNVLTGNNGGDGNPQVASGLQLGSNVCGGDLVCP